jgi:ketosteroid isomerase-like protein
VAAKAEPIVSPGAAERAQSAVRTPAPIPAPSAAPPVNPNEQLRGLVESWRQAWSDRDTEAYLGFYSRAFRPAKGLSLDHWIASRYRNVGGKVDIEVQIRELQLTMLAEGQARVTFLQDYRSGNYKETAQPKTLLLAREDDAWRIVKEWQGTQGN